MRTSRLPWAALFILLALPSVYAQEKPSNEPRPNVEAAPPEIPLKIQIVLTEFDGAQKISNLPNTIYTVATGPHNRIGRENLRFGVRVPVATGSSQFTYEDVGTTILCGAVVRDDGQFSLEFHVERSSVTVSAPDGKATDWKPGELNPGPQSLIRSFRDDFHLVMRDGRTMEGSSAVDPVTGHVLKIEVTLNVLK
jgi:hypothetical protein